MSLCGNRGLQFKSEDFFCTGCGWRLRRGGNPPTSSVIDEASASVAVIVPESASSTPKSDTNPTATSAVEIMKRIHQQLGFHMSTAVDAALVDIVFPLTPASQLGLLEGDVIVGVGNISVRGLAEFFVAMQKYGFAEPITLNVVRKGMELSLQIVP